MVGSDEVLVKPRVVLVAWLVTNSTTISEYTAVDVWHSAQNYSFGRVIGPVPVLAKPILTSKAAWSV